MKLEDKVDIKISVEDLKKNITDHLLVEHGVLVNQLHFNIKSIPDEDSIYSSYQLGDITGIGIRKKIDDV